MNKPQPDDAFCVTCRHKDLHVEPYGAGVVFMSCWKHQWEGPLLPTLKASAERDMTQYCCTLWKRSWHSRWQMVKKWFAR